MIKNRFVELKAEEMRVQHGRSLTDINSLLQRNKAL